MYVDRICIWYFAYFLMSRSRRCGCAELAYRNYKCIVLHQLDHDLFYQLKISSGLESSKRSVFYSGIRMEVNVVAPGAHFAHGSLDYAICLLHCIWTEPQRKSRIGSFEPVITVHSRVNN